MKKYGGKLQTPTMGGNDLAKQFSQLGKFMGGNDLAKQQFVGGNDLDKQFLPILGGKKKRHIPVKRSSSPVKRSSSPVKRSSSPVKRASSHVKRASSPVKRAPRVTQPKEPFDFLKLGGEQQQQGGKRK